MKTSSSKVASVQILLQ